MTGLRQIVREIMLSQGWAVENRPTPQILLNAGRNSYAPSENIVRVAGNDAGSLVHELCHSLQPVPATYISRADRVTAYLSQEIERQAYAIGSFFDVQPGNLHGRWDALDRRPGRAVRLRINALIRGLNAAQKYNAAGEGNHENKNRWTGLGNDSNFPAGLPKTDPEGQGQR